MRTAIYAIIAVLAFLIVGTMDYDDEMDAANHYDRMVCEGHWPDYDQRDPACEDFTHHSKRNDR